MKQLLRNAIVASCVLVLGCWEGAKADGGFQEIEWKSVKDYASYVETAKALTGLSDQLLLAWFKHAFGDPFGKDLTRADGKSFFEGLEIARPRLADDTVHLMYRIKNSSPCDYDPKTKKESSQICDSAWIDELRNGSWKTIFGAPFISIVVVADDQMKRRPLLSEGPGMSREAEFGKMEWTLWMWDEKRFDDYHPVPATNDLLDRYKSIRK